MCIKIIINYECLILIPEVFFLVLHTHVVLPVHIRLKFKIEINKRKCNTSVLTNSIINIDHECIKSKKFHILYFESIL